MFLHSAIQAGTYIAAKRALGELSPFELALARFTLSGAVYGALLWFRRVRVARGDLLPLAALGVVAIPLNQGLFLTGLARTTAGHAALLYALTPIFVFLLARSRLGERATLAKVAGIAVAFGGVLVVLLARDVVSLAGLRSQLSGDLLVLLGVVAWAVYVVGGKPYAERYGAIASTGLSVVFGSIVYLPFGLGLSHLDHLATLSRTGWMAVAYLVAFTSVASYVMYYWSLARTEASRVAIWSNLQPVLTALLAWAIYSEQLSAPFVAGGAMVLAGVVLTERD
jgi:drug/metabolite transporter (DMT)-like permease